LWGKKSRLSDLPRRDLVYETSALLALPNRLWELMIADLELMNENPPGQHSSILDHQVINEIGGHQRTCTPCGLHHTICFPNSPGALVQFSVHEFEANAGSRFNACIYPSSIIKS
jgi:hypothetical protein